MFKYIIILFMSFFIITAHTQMNFNEIYTHNSAGGFIVLSNHYCEISKYSKEYKNKAYSTETAEGGSKNGIIYKGCWKVLKNEIEIAFEDIDTPVKVDPKLFRPLFDRTFEQSI